MSLPASTITAQDYGLASVPSSAAKVVAKIGTCSLGTPLLVQQWSGPNLSAMQAALGTGPLVEAAARSLVDAGGPVTTIPLTKSVAGAAGTVAHSGTGTAVMTVAGAAADAYQVIVAVTTAAASLAAGAAFKYSLDNGATYTQSIALPTSGVYVIPGTGLTITFAEGTFVLAETYTFTCTAPAGTTSDVTAALTALRADARSFGWVHIVGCAAPVSGAVVHTGTGEPVHPELTGTPTGYIDAQYKITKGGALATAEASYSIDGGVTFAAAAIIPLGGAVVNHGVTCTFAAGTYVENDIYAFNTYGGIAALFTAVDTAMASAATAYKWAGCTLELPSTTDAIIAKATANCSSTRVMYAGGTCTLASATAQPGGATYSRPDAWPITSRIADSEISEDLGKVAHSGVTAGSVPGVSALDRDEYSTPGFGALRVETLRTIPGMVGYYIASDTVGGMMAPVGSDYAMVQHRRVMDRACVVALAAVQPYLNSDILCNPTTGFILETEAKKIEGQVGGALRADMLNGKVRHASALAITVKRDEAILTTKNLTIDVAVQPKGYAKTIAVSLHFAQTV